MPSEGTSSRPAALSRRRLALLAGLSNLSLFLAFPPVSLWPLAWASPLFWLLLVRHRHWEPAPVVSTAGMSRWQRLFTLPWRIARRPYGLIWCTSAVHWLVMMQGLRLAHWANHFSWIALGLYLGCYVPLFVGLTRVGVYRLRWPLLVVAPIVWTGLELFRAYVFTGFAGAMLGHTQVRWEAMIQIADTLGDFGVSFLVMFFAAGLCQAMPYAEQPRWRLVPLLAAVVLVAANLGYGHLRLRDESAQPHHFAARDPKPVGAVRVALVQCSFDTVFESNLSRSLEIYETYLALSQQASQHWSELNLIVWPEGTFSGDIYETHVDGPLIIPKGYDPDRFRKNLREWQQDFYKKLRRVAARINSDPSKTPHVSLLVGTETEVLRDGKTRMMNTALHIGPRGSVRNRYHKMHLVPFGEYLPLARLFPFLYEVTPMSGGLSPGTEPVAIKVGEMTASPSICFESMTPRVIRRQVLELTASGKAPDFLINVTNDGWFWGTSVLDMHFHCAVFRAIENRRHMLVAANTGITAWIGPYGRVYRQSPRRKRDIILAEIPAAAGHPITMYQRIGDWPARLCGLFCVVLGVLGCRERRADRSVPEADPPQQKGPRRKRRK